MNVYKNVSFVKLLVRFGLIFLIIITIIKIGVSIFQNGSFSGMQQEYFSTENFGSFVKIQLIMSLVYGAFMAGYYKFIKK